MGPFTAPLVFLAGMVAGGLAVVCFIAARQSDRCDDCDWLADREKGVHE